jgi:hypothetical protein
VSITNNLIVNDTGTGIYAGSMWKGSDQARAPRFDIEDNSVLFIWKYDPYAQSFSGNGFDCDPETMVSLRRNVFSFTDRIGVSKKGKWPILLEDNVISHSVGADYYEAYTDTLMALDKVLDEGEAVHPDSDGNVSATPRVGLSKACSNATASGSSSTGTPRRRTSAPSGLGPTPSARPWACPRAPMT